MLIHNPIMQLCTSSLEYFRARQASKQAEYEEEQAFRRLQNPSTDYDRSPK